MAVEVRNLDERQRFLDVNEEPDKPLPPLLIPITGEKGLLSVQECLIPVIDSNLVPSLLNNVAEALDKCKHPKDGLTQDQSAALYLYSLQSSFYERFNGALRNEDRTKAIPFYDYFKLFMSALNKLPSVQDNVWRGVTANISAEYTPGSIHIWHAASSCTDEANVTDTFLDKKKHRTLFNIKCYNGKSIKHHSRFPKETETVLPPGTCIRVKSQSNPAAKLHIISCEEIMLTSEEINSLLLAETVGSASSTTTEAASLLYLLWVDPNVNKSKQNVATHEVLHTMFENHFRIYDDLKECESFLSQKQNDQHIIIMSGHAGRNLLPKIHDLQQLKSVFVYCMDKKANEEWAKNYAKVKAVVTESQELIKEVENEKLSLSLILTNVNNHIPVVITPISGFEQQPLVSLEDALEPVRNYIEDIEKYIHITKQQCKPGGTDGLSKDESASIYIYTIAWSKDDASLYKILNDVLRSEDRSKIKPWFRYLKLIMTGLRKLPSFQGTVWRESSTDLPHLYPKGKRFVWWSFTNANANSSAIENFSHQSGKRILFQIECKNGKMIGKHSSFPSENEVLLKPGFYFEVKTVLEMTADAHIINIKEIDSP